MRNLSALRVFAASVFVVTGPSFADAADLAGYSKIVSESVQTFISGKVEDVKGLIAKQDAAIEIGIAACKEYAAKKPEAAKLLNHVIASVPKMKQMSAEQLEQAWGDEGNAGDEIGAPLSKLDQFSMVRNHLDLVVHPARARAFLMEYASTKSRGVIDEAKAELVEVLEHAKKIETGSK